MDKKNIIKILVLIPALFIVFIIFYRVLGPAQKSENIVYASTDLELPYNISLPDKTIQLPKVLREISGISYYDENTLACCEDETGTVYLVDIRTGDITHSYEFIKDADYEDIEVVRDMIEDMETKIYVLRSDGNIYRIKGLGSPDQRVKKYKTFLKAANNAEGLCYYKAKNTLLIACKGSVLSGTKGALFVFDLYTKKMQPKPLFVFDTDVTHDKSVTHINLPKKFPPSGISINPVDGLIYIISSVAKLLLVINPEGEVVSLSVLHRGLFRQPEGICFFPNGDLYISNEGRGGIATILQFKYKE
ncbi:MAG: SdiA-regulated domain-containing protein [Spirochaetales bacterium]|nr:SdiA-regulated domain-containing protein [Spirochaetales bacterium]